MCQDTADIYQQRDQIIALRHHNFFSFHVICLNLLSSWLVLNTLLDIPKIYMRSIGAVETFHCRCSRTSLLSHPPRPNSSLEPIANTSPEYGGTQISNPRDIVSDKRLSLEKRTFPDLPWLHKQYEKGGL